MTTIALDLATTCGFAVARDDGRLESGAKNFSPKSKDGPGARWVRFRQWLAEMKQAHAFTKATYEIVVGGGPDQIYAQQIYGGFVAVLQLFCELNGIAYDGHNVSTIKKAWTGKGNARKEEMVARCHELGFSVSDHNEADAIALLHVALGRVPQLPIERQVKKRPARKNPDKRTREIALDPF